jgi:hypothetical protein
MATRSRSSQEITNYTYDKSGKLIGFAKPTDLAGKHAEAIKAATGTLEDTAAANGVERQRVSAKDSLSKSVDALVAEIDALAKSVPSMKLNPRPELPIIA